MKKVMFAAAIAAFCATVHADVVSSEIVGYAQKEQQSGAYSKVACFDGVAAEAMDIQDIVPTQPDGEELYDGAFQIMTQTDDLATDRTYFYLTAETAESIDGVAKTGWFDDGMSYRLVGDDAVTFAPGEGFLVLSDFDDATVTFAGKVAKGDTIVPIGSGANFCGNNALQALDIQAIAIGTECDETGNVSTPVDDLYDGAFQIMTFTDDLATDKTYFYLTAETAESIDGLATEGWFDDGMSYRLTGDDAVSFESGEAFIVMSDFDEAYVKIPGNVLAE